MLSELQNPPMRSPAIESISGAPGSWWVGHTKARAEKAFAFDLLAREIPYFLPLVKRVRVWGGRKRQVLMPLFPSYVFFSGELAERQTALATDRLCNVIPVRQREPFVMELATIELALASGQDMQFFPHVSVGARVRVFSGPLEGVEGTILRLDGATRLVLQVSVLGGGASLEIDASLTEAVE